MPLEVFVHAVKLAKPDFPILDCIAQRWSPYSFEPRGVELDKLLSCLEAARWSASSFNEQPWNFIIARQEEENEFQRMLACLLTANQAWAKNAGVLMLTVIAKNFSRNGKLNRVAQHDLGLAIGNICCQATHLGLSVHQMAGVDLGMVRREYAIPDSHEPVTAIALGYAATDRSSPGDPLAQRDQSPRARKPLKDFVFTAKWGSSF